jgi:hypothetical protein
MITHRLKYLPREDRWRCSCGYTLGDGRKAFLAPCPAVLLEPEPEPEKQAYPENRITSKRRRKR